MKRTFLRFLLAGGIAAVANIGSRWLLDLVLPYVPSIVLAYLVGMTVAFLLNRRFVFPGARNALHAQAGWFVVVNALALLQTLVVSVALADYLLPLVGWPSSGETVAHVVGVLVPVFTSYVGHRRLSFRR